MTMWSMTWHNLLGSCPHSPTACRSLATRKCFFPPLVSAPIARLVEMTVGDCPFQGTCVWSPWDTARAVRRWSSQDQGCCAMGFDTPGARHPPGLVLTPVDQLCVLLPRMPTPSRLWKMLAIIIQLPKADEV